MAGQSVVKRRKRVLSAVFVDGIALDRASRRIGRKVSLEKLVNTVAPSSVVRRYYTVIPNQDDARHLSFIDSVRKRGFRVNVKRLLPKNIDKIVTSDVEMASDIIAFAFGNPSIFDLVDVTSSERRRIKGGGLAIAKEGSERLEDGERGAFAQEKKIVVVCPSGELYYPINLIRHSCSNTEVIAADFGKFSNRNIIAIASSWLDLSGSETIWKE